MKSRWFFVLLACALGCAVVDAFAQSEPAPQPSQGEAAASAQPASAAAPVDGSFPSDQLEQLVAPIALYPDSLLTQILMAATYPLEIVQADRFVKQNPELKDDALDAALKEKDWDPSVKSLCAFPDVLKQMSENLDWTQDLGDAFLGQQSDVMDTVQRMRGKAYEAGNLETTEQQVVTQQEDKIIVIEPSDPEVVYVPTYSSTVVYGSWGYPSYYYPPMYYPPPPGYGLISFGFGVAVGAAIWGNCSWGWGHTDIDIDVNRYNDFNRNTNINADRDRIQATGRDGKASWQHDANHRKGVNYRSPEVAQRNGAAAGSNRVTRDQARGRSQASVGNRATTGNRPGAGTSQARDRSAGAGGARATPTDRGFSGARDSRGNRNSAYSGSRSPSMDRRSSSRGAYSRGATSFGGSRGGRRGGGRRH